MGLLVALGLEPAAAMQGKAPTAPVSKPAASNGAPVPKPAASSSAPAAAGGKPQSPEMAALVTRFRATMARIKTLEAAGSPQAAALRRAAIDAGNMSTSAPGIVRANAALDKVEADLAIAQAQWARQSTGGAPQQPPQPQPPATSPPPTQPPVTRPPAATGKPEFKGYPSTLSRGEQLITQVKKYGFTEDWHATTMNAADRGDVQEIWCSGLSNWSLAEAGYNLDEKSDAPKCFIKEQKLDKKTGKMVEVTVSHTPSLRSLIEGGADNLYDSAENAPPKPTTKEEWKEFSRKAYAQPGLFGKTPAEDDPRVKGAAGAFVLAKIGTEILDLHDVKPGDFAQTRAVGSPKGHAFQIHACTCEGECLIGASGSPKLLKDLGGEVIATPQGQWYAKASFKIDGSTSPLTVGMHTVVNSDWLESNEPAMMEDKNDKDGGVQVRHGAAFEDPTKPGAKRTYIGRLSSSSWSGYVRGNAPLKRPGAEPAQAAPEAPARAPAPAPSTAPPTATAPAAPTTADDGADAPSVPADPRQLSGAHWIAQFPTSRSTGDLVSPFKENAEAFIAAIEAAGGEVDIAATLRPAQRAYLMHWAWMIGNLGADPTTVPARSGVDIVWDHGDHAASVAAAQAMIAAYGLEHKPSLNSRHIKGKAIDMDVSGIVGKTMKDRNGSEVEIASVQVLYSVGAGYGVRKLVTDPPHWSDTGG